jgi:hypothetical protein
MGTGETRIDTSAAKSATLAFLLLNPTAVNSTSKPICRRADAYMVLFGHHISARGKSVEKNGKKVSSLHSALLKEQTVRESSSLSPLYSVPVTKTIILIVLIDASPFGV